MWEGARPRDDTEARATLDQLRARWLGPHHVDELLKRHRGEAARIEPPSPAIRAYLQELLARFPDIGEPGGDLSPWSDGPLINNASGPIMYFGFALGLAQLGAPFAANVAASHGLVCFDPQTETLWDDDLCLNAIRGWEGTRTIEPALSPIELDQFDAELRGTLEEHGFRRWALEPWNGWRVDEGPAGGFIRVEWTLVGHREPGAVLDAYLHVRNEIVEQAMLGCRVVRPRWAGPMQWTHVQRLEEAIEAPLPRTIAGYGDALSAARLISLRVEPIRAFVRLCADPAFLLTFEPLDRHRRAVAQALLGDTQGALAGIEAIAAGLGQRPRAEEWLRFADWVEFEFPSVASGLSAITEVDWEPPQRPFKPETPPLSEKRRALLRPAAGGS